MDNQVTIEISGRTAVGKTTIAFLINQALQKAGISTDNIQINCMDGDFSKRTQEQIDRSLSTLIERDLKVIINDNNQRPRIGT